MAWWPFRGWLLNRSICTVPSGYRVPTKMASAREDVLIPGQLFGSLSPPAKAFSTTSAVLAHRQVFKQFGLPNSPPLHPILCLSISSSIQLPLGLPTTLDLRLHRSLSSSVAFSHPLNPLPFRHSTSGLACVKSPLNRRGSTKSG